MANRLFSRQFNVNQELSSYFKFAAVCVFIGIFGLVLSLVLSVGWSLLTGVILPVLSTAMVTLFGLKPICEAYSTRNRRWKALKKGVKVNALVLERKKSFNLFKGLSSRLTHKVKVKRKNDEDLIFEFETTERFLKPFIRYEIGEEIKGFVDFTSRAFFFPKELNQ